MPTYEVIVAVDVVNNARTKTRSVTYLIRESANVKAAQITLPTDIDAAAYGAANAGALYAAGITPPHKASPLALFYATQSKMKEGYFLNVIFSGVYQLKLGGTLGQMVTASRQAFGQDDVQLADWQAFEAAWNAANAEDREALTAMAVWIALNLVAID